MKTFYLDFKKAMRKNFVIDRATFFAKYSDENKKGYVMMKGTPLVRNIDGFLIYESDIPDLLKNQRLRFLHGNLVARGVSILYKWC